MKDIFIPIILFVTTILGGVLFLTKIYQPQQDTLDILAENSQNSSFAVTYVADGNNEMVSGTVVKSTIDYYSVDNTKEVCVKKGGSSYSFVSNHYADGIVTINNDEQYIKEVERDAKSKEIIRVIFTLKGAHS